MRNVLFSCFRDPASGAGVIPVLPESEEGLLVDSALLGCSSGAPNAASPRMNSPTSGHEVGEIHPDLGRPDFSGGLLLQLSLIPFLQFSSPFLCGSLQKCHWSEHTRGEFLSTHHMTEYHGRQLASHREASENQSLPQTQPRPCRLPAVFRAPPSGTISTLKGRGSDVENGHPPQSFKMLAENLQPKKHISTRTKN